MENKEIYCKPEFVIYSYKVEIITTSGNPGGGGFGNGQELPDIDL